MPRPAPELTVVIPTRDRVESLRRTVVELSRSSVHGRTEVVVVDNAEEPAPIAAALRDVRMPVRVLHEPRPGKASALNCAIRGGALSPLVAVLDDDMDPQPGWCDAVLSSAASRPAFDVFGGRSHVVWPLGAPPPPWATDPFATGVAFSVVDLGDQADFEMGVGATLAFPSGNHFWFRSRVLDTTGLFEDVWAPEPEFVLRARARGHRGVFVREVSCGHRVQPELFDAAVFVRRARAFGHIMGRIEAIGRPSRAGGRFRAAASLLRSAGRRIRWGGAQALACVLPARGRAPARALAAWYAAREVARMENAWRRLVGATDEAPAA